MQWYYANDDQRLGPVSHVELERLARAGKIGGDTLVWRKGMDQWETLDTVRAREPELFEPEPPPLPAAAAGVPETGEPRVRRAPVLAPEEERPAAPEVLLYAGFWRRFGAHLVDLAIWWVVWQLLTGVIGAVYFPEVMAIAQKGPGYQPRPEEIVPLLRFFGVALAVGLAWAVVYDLLFIPRFGATPGKLLFGLRLVRANGRPPGFFQVVGRTLSKWLVGLPTLCIGYLVVAFDDEKRGLHDYLARTRVVKKRQP